ARAALLVVSQRIVVNTRLRDARTHTRTESQLARSEPQRTARRVRRIVVGPRRMVHDIAPATGPRPSLEQAQLRDEPVDIQQLDAMPAEKRQDFGIDFGLARARRLVRDPEAREGRGHPVPAVLIPGDAIQAIGAQGLAETL